MSGSSPTTATQVAAAYTAILRVAPPGGATGAYSTSIAAQINQGLLTLGNFESSLINLDQTTYTTLAGLVTIDAFYNASPSSATLTTVATATSGTSFETAAELHNLGYSDANVWTILGAGWGADPTSNFYALYNGQATGNLNDYTTFINAVYLREFGSLPSAANLQNLLNDIPGLSQLLSGGGHIATPIQIMGGLYGYLLYTGQANNVGVYAAKADAFLALAATDEATTPGSSAALYGPEILTNPAIGGTGPTPTSIFLTTAADNVTGTAIYGSLTPFSINGVGPTLNADDIINGSPGTTSNTLTISDDYGTGNDTIPLGTTINNIQNVVLQTAGNAGGGSALFDTTPYSSVNNVVINSSGYFQDTVKVSGTTALTVNHQSVAGGSVQTYGGTTVTATDSAPAASTVTGDLDVLTIGSTAIAGANPSGAIVANAVGAFVTVYGGTTVNVNQSSIGGGVTIGTAGFSVSPAEPSGAVTVNAPATSTVASGTPISVFGGASANLTSGGGLIQIGGPITPAGNGATNAAFIGQTVFTVTGNDMVVDNAAVPLAYNYVTTANTGIAPVTPDLSIFDENTITILGGQAINVTTNAGGVTVGQTAAVAYNGTVLIPGLLSTGNVTITDTSDLSPHNAHTPTATGPVGFASTTPVFVYGGADVTVTDSGSPITVGNNNGANVVAPTGTVTATDTAQVAHDGIVNLDDNVVTDIGGIDVKVTTNAGDVTIGTGGAGILGTEPTGNITVTDTGTDTVTAFGGIIDTIAATNGAVLLGAGNTTTNPTGNVSVTESGLFTGDTGILLGTSSVTVDGGVNVTVATTGGAVTVGTAKTPVTGAVVITDTQVGASSDGFTVIGGAAGATGPSVSITTTATSGAIQVAPSLPVFTGTAGNGALNAAGTALKTPADYANGTVSIVDESVAGSPSAGTTNVYGTGAINVATNGATAVTIVGGGLANVVDEQTTLATGGAAAGSAIGTSTLATVSLDGVGAGLSTLISGVLANLSVLDSAKGSPTDVAVVSPAALTLTLNNDAGSPATGWAAISDAKATSITIASPTGATASSAFELAAGAATSLTFTNIAPVTLFAATALPITSSDGAVKTITITGSGAVTLPDFTTGSTVDGALSAITGTGSSGPITVGGISVFATAFTPGSGVDAVTITNNPNPGAGQTVQKITGATGSTITANYVALDTDQALHSVSQISGFSTLGLGPLANSFVLPYALTGFTGSNPYDAGSFSNLTVGATAGSVEFSDVGAGTTNLAITAPQGGASTITYLLNDAVAELDPLAITIGYPTTTTSTTGITSAITLGIDHFTSTKPSIAAVGNVSINSIDPTTVTTPNVVNIFDTSPGLNGNVAGSGTVSISVSGSAPATVTYVSVDPSSVSTINDTDTATVDVTGVALSSSGATFSAGGGLLKAFGSGELAGSADNTKALDTFTTGSGGGVFTLGSGGGWNTSLTNKVGGVPTTPAGSNDSGNETVILSASSAVSDTLNVGPAVVSINNGAGVGGITGFQAVAAAKVADVIALTGTGAFGNSASGAAGVSGYSVLTNAAANNSSPAGVQNVYNFISQTGGGIAADLANLDPKSLLASLTFSSSNGVISFGAVDGSNINQFNPTQLLTAAEGIATEEAWLTGQDQVATFTAAFAGLPSNTYIVASDFYNKSVTVGSALTGNFQHIFGATEIELNGVTGLTGFGATAALNVAELIGATTIGGGPTAPVGQVVPGAFNPSGPAGPAVFHTLFNGGLGNQGTTTGTAYNDAGFSEDTLGGGATPANASSTNSYNNLGSAAQIDITAAGSVGALVVGAQIGTQGSDSFVLNFNSVSNAHGLLDNGAVTLAGLTVTSDDLVTVLLNGFTDTISAFSDPNGTVSSLVASGAGSLVLPNGTSSISDTALTSIDAHLVTGSLTVSATESGLTINGATGGDTINASGSADTITIGSATLPALGGPIEITANASGDTVTITHEGNGISALVGAASGGDTITVDAGSNSLAGTFSVAPPAPGSTFATSLGTADTINLHSAAASGAAFTANDFAWVGSGTTVNLGTTTAPFGSTTGADNATVAVIGDATGATSGSSPAMTVITGFATAGANANLYLQFDNSAAAGHISFTTAPTVPALIWAGSVPTLAAPNGLATLAQVNEASATSLANALDIAASQTVQTDAFHQPTVHTTVAGGVAQLNAATALADWFQYGGNTYIVEAINSTAAAAAHTALGTGDVVVELTGLINVATNAQLHVI